MPIRFDDTQRPSRGDGGDVGISDREIVQLVSAFRPFGLWRIDLDTGLFYGTRDIYGIFDMEYREGPINLVEFRDHLHPEDLPMLMESFEQTSTQKQMHHNIYRVIKPCGEYKFVRTIGKFREKEGTSGEIIGVTYEFFERLRTAAFCEDTELTASSQATEN
ncbi:PAS domain-containing protein [Rhizobium sp. RU36D]|uniref:PAS domain-containing protein n=1 Tax=Rhizobium sp. RU36D TaxID=1907415 RepID=UPI0009D839B8|nr:PAS domain-containing protein [Rhizobium sp. RU36D]SMD03531.1 PAS fold-containing protein [Rhizobium sp. RU36D]